MVKIIPFEERYKKKWDGYVRGHDAGTLYHLSSWKDIIQDTYAQQTHFLLAISFQEEPIEKIDQGDELTKSDALPQNGCVVGVLPLVLLKHFYFGTRLCSVPYFDTGGILADNPQAYEALLQEALKIAEKHIADSIELRYADSYHNCIAKNADQISNRLQYETTEEGHTERVRMILDLPASPALLLKSFKSKLRSQIRKPVKEGLHSKLGGSELLDDFYWVFCVNMRDLGSPVHSKRMMANVLKSFPEDSKIIMVYKDDLPLACSLVIAFNGIIENPWASSLRAYSKLSPNMLLYWQMLEYACDAGVPMFNFGRSRKGEGTYKFKLQWGAKPYPMYWEKIYLVNSSARAHVRNKSNFGQAIAFWKKLPLPITRYIGPFIRKNIEL